MAYYVRNKEKNGIEIYFDGKPEEIIRDELKKNKWRWTNVRHCWWHYYSAESEDFAKKLCNGHEEQSPLNANEQTHNFQASSLSARGKSISQNSKTKQMSLTKTSAEQTLDLRRVMQAVGGVYVNRDRLRGVMKDLYPQSILNINILLSVYESGIPKALSKKKSITNLEFTHYVDQIVRDYGLQVNCATYGVNEWLKYNGIYSEKLKYSGSLKTEKATGIKDESNTSENKILENQRVISNTIDGYSKNTTIYNSLDLYIEYRGLERHYDTNLIPNIYFENHRKEKVEIRYADESVNGFQFYFSNNSATISPGNKYLTAPSFDFIIGVEELKQCQIKSIDEIKFIIRVQRKWDNDIVKIPVVIRYNPPFVVKKKMKQQAIF